MVRAIQIRRPGPDAAAARRKHRSFAEDFRNRAIRTLNAPSRLSYERAVWATLRSKAARDGRAISGLP